ncbi:MAG TPA: DinB family protein [Candidatus Limnocylindria bacterium]|nr:DinB family protein [Candidatus Limnocylindria bacterium]
MADLRFDDDVAFRLMDDAATVARIVRTAGDRGLAAARFGDWNGLQLLGHVTLMGEVFMQRVARCIEEDEPAIQAVDDGALTESDAMDLSKRLLASHQRIVAMLQQDTAARERVGIHSERGRVTAGWLAGYCAKHSHEHVSELAERFAPAA